MVTGFLRPDLYTRYDKPLTIWGFEEFISPRGSYYLRVGCSPSKWPNSMAETNQGDPITTYLSPWDDSPSMSTWRIIPGLVSG